MQFKFDESYIYFCENYRNIKCYSFENMNPSVVFESSVEESFSEWTNSFMYSDLLFDGEKLIVLDDNEDFYSDTGNERNCVLRVYVLESDGVKYYCKWYGSLGGENRQICNYTFFIYTQINTLS